MVYKLKPLAIAIAAANMAISLPLFAQETEKSKAEVKVEDVEKDENSNALEVITVSATKRDTALMDTGLAISAFTEKQLEKLGITNVKDLNNVVPNMSIMVDNESSAPIITMRGVRSTNTTEWGDPAVGVHYDGIYSPRPQGALALMFDVERVEALRGPQGTLFGRNSTVGSLNIISAKPKIGETEGKVSLEVGRFNQQAIKGVINLPVTDNFALRASFFKETKDSNMNGYYDPNQWDQRYLNFDESQLVETDRASTTAGNNADFGFFFADQLYKEVKADPADFYNNADQYAFRIAGLYSPSDEMSWLVTFERYRDQGAGGIGGRDCDRIKDRPVEVNGGSCTDIWGDEDNFTAYVNIPGSNDMTLDSIRSHFIYDINDELQFVYNAGYQSQERSGQMDLDQGYYFWDQMLKWVDTDYDSTSHELQLKSMGDGPLQWIAGYFNFKEDNYMNGQYHGAMGGVSLWLQPERIVKSEAIFAQGTYELTDKLFLTLGARYTRDSKEDKGGRNYGCWGGCYPAEAWGMVQWGLINWGAFGDLSQQSPEYLASTTIPRDTLNALPSDYLDYPTEDFNIDTVNDVKEDWSKTTWRIGLDYDLDENSLLYAYVANGYKGGGIGDVLIKKSDNQRYDTSYDGETVVTYELGYKTTMLDGAMNLRANYFYSDYENQQFSAWTIYDSYSVIEDDPELNIPIERIQNDGTFLTRNASNSKISGLELEMEWNAWENGHIGGYLTFLDTEITSDYWKEWGVEAGQVFKDHQSAVTNDDGSLVETLPWVKNYKGHQLAYSPEASFTINIGHTFHLASGATISPFLNVHWEDESYTSIDNVDKWQLSEDELNEGIDLDVYSDKRDAWATATFSLNFTSADKSWYAEAYVYNLTDEDVNWWQGYSGNTPVAGKAQRSWGARVGYNF